jgi:hypothetical protein
MRRVDRLFEKYGLYHQDPVNKAIHWMRVPLISELQGHAVGRVAGRGRRGDRRYDIAPLSLSAVGHRHLAVVAGMAWS